jgi:hypothetical protein
MDWFEPHRVFCLDPKDDGLVTAPCCDAGARRGFGCLYYHAATAAPATRTAPRPRGARE